VTLPLAASPTSPTPGLSLIVNLKPTTVSPGSQTIRGLIVGPKNASGTITANTQVKAITSQDLFETYAGIGSLPGLAYKKLAARYPSAQIDYIAPPESGGAAATGSLTWAGTLTSAGTAHIVVQGVAIDVPWNVGEDIDAMRTKVTTYVGRYASRLFATCTSSATTGVNTFTANTKGPVGNDVTLRCTLEGCAGGSVTVSAARLTGGTTEPDFTTALALAAGTEYDFIGLCISNADAAATAGNFAKLKTYIKAHNEGNGALLQQGVCAYTLLRTGITAAAAAMNEQFLEIMCSEDDESLPCEIMGDEMGDRMYWVTQKYSRNRIGNPSLICGSDDPAGDMPTIAESDAALLAGVSLIGYAADKSPCVLRSITTYTQTPAGAAILPTDCNEIDAMYQYAKDLRAALPVEFANCQIAPDSDEPGDELPEGVIEERDIKAFIVNRTKEFWIRKGIFSKKYFDAHVADLIVKINDVDENQVDIFIPQKPSKNLAKMGVYVQKAG
jgi:phage tail sheath gpL-like